MKQVPKHARKEVFEERRNIIIREGVPRARLHAMRTERLGLYNLSSLAMTIDSVEHQKTIQPASLQTLNDKVVQISLNQVDTDRSVILSAMSSPGKRYTSKNGATERETKIVVENIEASSQSSGVTPRSMQIKNGPTEQPSSQDKNRKRLKPKVKLSLDIPLRKVSTNENKTNPGAFPELRPSKVP